jgi:hypothetical protein
MKNLYKIITLFAIIFIVGVYLTIITVNSSLNKFETQEKIVEIERNTTFLLKAEKKTG